MEGDYHLRDRVESVLAIVELKYKSHRATDEPFLADVAKVREWIRSGRFPDCHFYLGFIQEAIFESGEKSWLLRRQQESWASGRVTELVATLAKTGLLVPRVKEY